MITQKQIIENQMIEKAKNELSKFPCGIIKRYKIELIGSVIHIFEPNFVSIPINKSFCITERDSIYCIETNEVIVTLWKHTTITHITIF